MYREHHGCTTDYITTLHRNQTVWWYINKLHTNSKIMQVSIDFNAEPHYNRVLDLRLYTYSKSNNIVEHCKGIYVYENDVVLTLKLIWCNYLETFKILTIMYIG